MKKRSVYVLLSLLVLSSLLLSACQTGEAAAVNAASSAPFTTSRLSARNCNYGGLIKSIQSIDRYTVQFDLCRGDAAFPARLAVNSFAILSQQHLNKTQGVAAEFNQTPVGTGPYVLKSWVLGENLTLSANPAYWGIPPRATELQFRWTGSAIGRLGMVNSADLVDNPGPLTGGAISALQGSQILSRSGMNTVYLGINNSYSPFDDVNIRQAFGYLIDRQTLVEKVFAPGSLVADQLIPPFIEPGFSAEVRWYDYNPNQGMELLRGNKFNFSKPLVLAYKDEVVPYLPVPSEVAGEIKSQLAFYGISVILKPMAADNFEQALLTGSETLFLRYEAANYLDASAFFAPTLSAASRQFGALDPTVVNQAALAASSADENQRADTYVKINQYIKDQVPLVPLGISNPPVIARNSLENPVVGPLSENLEELGNNTDRVVFVQSQQPGSLLPADEADVDSLRVTGLIYDTLVRIRPGGTELQPGLADSWEANADLTSWTFKLRYDIQFSDGDSLDAGDVMATFAAIWDLADVNHRGNSGKFAMWKDIFGEFIDIYTRVRE